MKVVDILMLLAGTVGLVCWLLQREEKAAAKLKSEIPDPYDTGEAAGKAGEPFWANPHCVPSGGTRSHERWMAGWSYGKQQREAHFVQPTSKEIAP